jgi:hypothetical protein
MSDIGKGFHFHVFGFAILDVIGTILGGWAIAYYMKWSIPITIFVVFVIGIIIHRVLNIRTTIDKLLFKDQTYM